MKKLLSTALLSLPLLASAAPTNLVVNGDFEATAVSNGNWVNVSSVPGWTRVAGPGTGFEVRNNVAGQAYSGSNYIELDTNGNTTIEQLFNSLATGAEYVLTFAYSPRPGVAASSNGINVLWNGVQLAPTITGQIGGSLNQWTLYTYDVFAKAGSNSLRFASTGSSDSLGGSLDAVSLKVPEPSGIALAGLALVGLLAARRRRV